MVMKTKLRLRIEHFLADDTEFRDDWMSIPCKPDERTKVYSLVYSMQHQGYPIDTFNYDKAAEIFWVKRKEAVINE